MARIRQKNVTAAQWSPNGEALGTLDLSRRLAHEEAGLGCVVRWVGPARYTVRRNALKRDDRESWLGAQFLGDLSEVRGVTGRHVPGFPEPVVGPPGHQVEMEVEDVLPPGLPVRLEDRHPDQQGHPRAPHP